MRRHLFLIALLPAMLFAQEANTQSLSDLQFLIGSWTGEEHGAAGDGVGTRTYEFVIKDRYLLHRNQSRFEPQEKNPKGEIHEDWAVFNSDSGRGALVMRSFHGEGFAITAVLQPQEQPDVFVFLSEAIDNAPAGMRTRYTITRTSDDAFTETFELAMPGKEFGPLLNNSWRRVK